MKPKWIKILFIVLLLGLFVLGGGYAGYRGYKSIRQARLVKEARGYLDQKELRKAQLCLQRAVRYNNRDLETCRLMARLAEESGSAAGALLWRGRVVELNPPSLDDRLALAQAAVANRDFITATNALAAVDARDKQTATFHNIAGGVAAAANLTTQAEEHFREATRLEPENAIMQLNLAVVHLSQTNAPDQAQARTSLKAVAKNPTNATLRCEALRHLTMDALRHNQTDAAQMLTQQLLMETNSVFRDRLLRLEVLRVTKSAQFNPTLVTYQLEAITNTGTLFELSAWQINKLGAESTLAWLRTLPAETRTNQPAALFLAQCLAATKNWTNLQAALDVQNWGDLDFYRRAYKTLALRGQALDGASKAEWELALRVANNQLRGLVMLKNFAAEQKWLSEAEEVLWTIVRRFPTERGAVQELSQVLYFSGRTRPFMNLFTQVMQRDPNDLAARNNVALAALLLEANELKPHDLAREAYEKAPTNSACASTYAYSLHVQAKDAQALKVMQNLGPKALEDPSISGYYGLILKATGDSERAKTYLNWAFKSPLLPEERKLFETARSRN